MPIVQKGNRYDLHAIQPKQESPQIPLASCLFSPPFILATRTLRNATTHGNMHSKQPPRGRPRPSPPRQHTLFRALVPPHTHSFTTSPTSSDAHPSHSGDSIILGIFNDMVAVGEQQESLLLRELETDITVSRCMQILSFLEQNIDLVSTFPLFSRLQRFNTSPKHADETGETGETKEATHVGSTWENRGELRRSLTESQLQLLKSNYLKARDQFYQVVSTFPRLMGRRKWLFSPNSTAASFSAVISRFSRKNSRTSSPNIRPFSGIP